jgi:predicted nucleotidyltransferase
MKNDGIDHVVKNKIIGVLQVLFPGAKIYLYGSRARGVFSQYSDIDLAIDAGAGKERLRLDEARSMLEASNIPYKIDLVDLNHATGSFRESIVKDGVLWN